MLIDPDYFYFTLKITSDDWTMQVSFNFLTRVCVSTSSAQIAI